MKHGSLFSGIGGFDLAAEKMGWENVFHCEWEEFPRRVLNYYWPNTISYGDITKTDFTIHRGNIDILTGGFPCQPYSAAGKRLGKEDDRHLWPSMCRAIREIQPAWVVGENVYGLINWNGGLVFDEVQADLEAEGYQVQPYVLPACGVNAPHRRYRIWFVAYRANSRAKDLSEWEDSIYRSGVASNSDSKRLQRREKSRSFGEVGEISNKQPFGFYQLSQWEEFPTQPPVLSGDDGISLDLDRITFSKWRRESIKAAGNAVVPQVVLQIFRAIEKYSQ